MGLPVVSIVMPMYNAMDYVAEAIESVLNQTFSDFELIIVNDGSTDGSLAIAETYAQKDSRIIILNQSNSGRPAVPKNAGIAVAKGEFIAFLDNDDLYEASKLSCMIDAFRAFPDYNVVFSDMAVFEDFDPENRYPYLGSINWFEKVNPYLKKLKSGIYGCTGEFYGFMSTKVTSITTQTVMIRSSALLQREGPFDESLCIGEDIDLWFHLAMHNKILYIDKILAFYRRHKSNITTSSVKNSEGFIAAHSKNLERAKGKTSLTNIRIMKSRISQEWNNLGYYNVKRYRFAEARNCYLKSMKLHLTFHGILAWSKSWIHQLRKNYISVKKKTIN